jgi:spore coat protein U-like protein
MKHILVILLMIAICTQAEPSTAAQSSDTQTQVSVAVKESCRFSSSALTLSFGQLDPSSTSPVQAAVNTQFWCTKGTGATIKSNDGLHYTGNSKRMKHSTAPEYIPYTLTLKASSLSGGGKNTARELVINGFIANSDYVNVRVGNYSDTVELRITP